MLQKRYFIFMYRSFRKFAFSCLWLRGARWECNNLLGLLRVTFQSGFFGIPVGPKGKAVRANGQITEVKQPRPWLILRSVTILHPQFVFQFGRNIGQICQLNWNFKETRMPRTVHESLHRARCYTQCVDEWIL